MTSGEKGDWEAFRRGNLKLSSQQRQLCSLQRPAVPGGSQAMLTDTLDSAVNTHP